jgi:hypothetical protein
MMSDPRSGLVLRRSNPHIRAEEWEHCYQGSCAKTTNRNGIGFCHCTEANACESHAKRSSKTKQADPSVDNVKRQIHYFEGASIKTRLTEDLIENEGHRDEQDKIKEQCGHPQRHIRWF